MKKSADLERRERNHSSSRSARSNRSRRGCEDENDESSQPPAVRPPRPGAAAVHGGGDSSSLAKTRDFAVVQNVDTSRAANLEMFSVRAPDENHNNNNNNNAVAHDDDHDHHDEKKSKKSHSALDEMDEEHVGAFAVQGQAVEHRETGHAVPPQGPVSLVSSSPPPAGLLEGSAVQHLAVAAQVADSQVQEEVRRALAGAAAGADAEIHAEIDAHVRRILAESAVPAENVLAVDESSVPVGASPRPAMEPTVSQQKSRRNKRICIVALILAVIAIAVGVAVYVTSSNSGNDDSDGTTTGNPGPSPPLSTPAPTPSGPTWLQLGNDINGVDEGGIFGNSVSLNKDGTVVAAGAPQSSFIAPNGGYVSIHQYNSAMSAWEQRGQILNSTRVGEYLGWSVSLSNDGSRIAISADGFDQVRAYEYDGSIWTELGQVLVGPTAGDRHGSTVALSGDGTTLAAAAHGTSPGSSPGYVRVYRYSASTSTWDQVGNDIVAPSGGVDTIHGYSLSLSSGGGVLALGADETLINGTGVVQVYEYDAASVTWVKLGEELRGAAAKDRFGFSNSLNSLGTLLAVGAPAENLVASGYVRVYEYSSLGWMQIGPDLSGKIGDDFGSSVSLADTNDVVVAVGAKLNSDNGQYAGKAVVFEYSALELDWVLSGQDILGASPADEFGVSVSLSGDAGKIAIGGRWHNADGLDGSGHVQVYNLVELRRHL